MEFVQFFFFFFLSDFIENDLNYLFIYLFLIRSFGYWRVRFM